MGAVRFGGKRVLGSGILGLRFTDFGFGDLGFRVHLYYLAFRVQISRTS